MFTTRRTITIARAVAILSAAGSYALSYMFLNLLVLTGSAPWLCTILTGAASVWVWDTYLSARADYIVRMSLLGVTYGIAASGIAVLFR